MIKRGYINKLKELDRTYDFADFDRPHQRKFIKKLSGKRLRQQLKNIDNRNEGEEVAYKHWEALGQENRLRELLRIGAMDFSDYNSAMKLYDEGKTSEVEEYICSAERYFDNCFK